MGKIKLFYKYLLFSMAGNAFLIVKETQSHNFYSIGWIIVPFIEFILFISYNKSSTHVIKKLLPLYLIIQQIALISGTNFNPLAIYYAYIPEHVIVIKLIGNSIGGKMSTISLLITLLYKTFYFGLIYDIIIPNIGSMLLVISEYFLLEGLFSIMQKYCDRITIEKNKLEDVILLFLDYK